MIYQRIQGRTETGYKIKGNFKAVDSEDKCFSCFVDYIGDIETKDNPEMYFGYNERLSDGRNVFVVGKNALAVSNNEDSVFTRGSQMSHKYIYADEDYDEILKNPKLAVSVENFYTSMNEYNENNEVMAQPKYKNFPDYELVEMATKYGITEDRLIDFVYALCTTIFDIEQRLYIALPDVSDGELDYAKHFIGKLMDCMPMFLKRRFGFVSCFASNDYSKAYALPVGISCVFHKNNFADTGLCEYCFDKASGSYYSVELNPMVENFIVAISDYIFNGDRKNLDFFEQIDSLYMNVTNISFEVVVAYYVRSKSENIGEILWSNKLLWRSGINTLRKLLLIEGEEFIENNIFSENDYKLKVVRVLLNVIDNAEFQKNVADCVCSKAQGEWETGYVFEFISEISKPVRADDGKSYEEKTTARFGCVFENELYNNAEYIELATREIINVIEENIITLQGLEEKTRKIIEIADEYNQKGYAVIKSSYFQNNLFEYIRPISFNGINLKTRKIVYEFALEKEGWKDLLINAEKDTFERLMIIAQDEEQLSLCRSQLKENNNEILNEFVKPFAISDNTGAIQEGIVNKFKLELFMNELDCLAGNPKGMMDFLIVNRGSQIYIKYFNSVEEKIKTWFTNTYSMDINNKDSMEAFAFFLGELERKKGINVACSFFKKVVEIQLLNVRNYTQEPAERISAFIRNFFSSMNMNSFMESTKKEYKVCLNNLLVDWHQLKTDDVVELSRIVKEYLNIDSISRYMDRAFYKGKFISELFVDSEYMKAIKISPREIVKFYEKNIDDSSYQQKNHVINDDSNSTKNKLFGFFKGKK